MNQTTQTRTGDEVYFSRMLLRTQRAPAARMGQVGDSKQDQPRTVGSAVEPGLQLIDAIIESNWHHFPTAHAVKKTA